MIDIEEFDQIEMRVGTVLEVTENKKSRYLDNENYPQISIKLYRYDGAACLAVVDGQPVSLVERSSVVDLIEAVHAIVLR